MRAIAATVAVAAALVALALYLRARDGETTDPPDSATALACEPAGSAELSGRVGIHQLGPIRAAWYDEFLAGAYVIVIDEDASSCGNPGREERHLVVWLPCGPARSGGYPVVRRDEIEGCEQPAAGIMLEGPDAADLGQARSGKLIIDTVHPCLTGRFEAEFPGGSRLSGRFAAAVCASP